MSGIHRVALAELVLDGKARSAASGDDEIWNLNLDQIESNSGRILEKVMLPVEDLGPSTYPFEAGTVLYSKLRPYLNKVVVADQDGFATTELVPLRCKPELVNPTYLAYFLRSAEFLGFASAVVAGAKMPRMVMSEFWKHKIPLPSLSEQRRIAAILDKAGALCAKRREALAQLDRLAQAIFLEMFGEPSQNPRQWPVRLLGNLITAGPQNGLYKPANDYGAGVPILRIDAFYDGVVTKLSSLKRLQASEKELALYGLQKNDLVINRVNSLEYLGKSALIPDLAEPTVFESNMMRFSVDLAEVDPVYLICFLQSGFVKRQILSCAKNSINQSSINQQDVKGLQIVLPPLSMQKTFASRIKAIESMKISHLKAQAEAGMLFSSLQHRAFRGEL